MSQPNNGSDRRPDFMDRVDYVLQFEDTPRKPQATVSLVDQVDYLLEFEDRPKPAPSAPGMEGMPGAGV